MSMVQQDKQKVALLMAGFPSKVPKPQAEVFCFKAQSLTSTKALQNPPQIIKPQSTPHVQPQDTLSVQPQVTLPIAPQTIQPQATLPTKSKVLFQKIQRQGENSQKMTRSYPPTSSNPQSSEVDGEGGVTSTGRFYASVDVEARRKAQLKEEAVVTEEDIAEFVKIFKKSKYDVVEQLKKTSSHISIYAFIKILKETQVPTNSTPAHFEQVVRSTMTSSAISFLEEIPKEGCEHVKALYITIKTRGLIVPRVLVDNGSALNVCSFATLQSLGLDETHLQPSDTIIRAFDGTQRTVLGEIELSLEVGPTSTLVKFQVLHIPSACNLLLGRPWIHAIGGVPSSLHQSIKFASGGKLVTVYAEEEAVQCVAPTIPFVGDDFSSSY